MSVTRRRFLSNTTAAVAGASTASLFPTAIRTRAQGVSPSDKIVVGVIGGTLSFGSVGLFVGPVALGIGYKLLTEWTRRDDDQSVLEPGE